MQVAKNYYLSSEKTFTRKFTEILLALKIEKALSKEEILELYVNKIYLGKRAYGIEAAAQVYYGKSITELNLAELAMIAGLPQAPSAANPIRSPERAVSRRNYVLARMYNLGKISEAEFQQSIRQPATARYHGATSEISAPYVAEMIRLEMIRRYGNKAYTSGYSVYTTINAKRQQAANAALQKGLLKYDRDHGYRGAQATYSVIPLSVPEPSELEEWMAQADPTKDVDWPQTLNNWEEQLRELGDFGIIEPAVVMNAIEEGAWVYSVGQIRWLPFEGMTWAAPYLSVNSVGEAPENALDVVSDGDLIWLEATSSGLKLAQVPEAEGALVSMNPHNGAIEALVGGFSNSDNQFNRATQAERQPGSAFKPFIYSAALDNGFTTASLINDAPVVFKDASLESTWRPENYSGKFYGPTRLRQALYRSQNLVSIRILKQMGPATAVRYIQDFGFNPARLNKDLSLALGASAVTPLDMATGYSAFANGGYKVSPFVMQSIISDTGEILYEANPALAMASPEEDSTGNFISAGVNNNSLIENDSGQAENIEEPTLFAERIMSPENHYLTVSMMRDVVRRGTGRKALALGRNDLAGKTGTTNDQKDAWFSGFNPDLVATVWIGFDQPTTLGRWASGGGTALPVWVDYMREALDGAPEEQFEQPEGIVTVRIDPDSGLLASPGQKDAIFEYFKAGSAPTEYARTKDIIPYQEDETGSRGGSVIPEQLF